MMGNFSFGDYFKSEAIAYSWEFLTDEKWLGLDPKRLSFTVFEDDDEAYNCWAAHIKKVGIDPSTRIMRLSEETNYWPPKSISKGSPGPCGPNSEMFYWTNPATVPGTKAGDYTREQWIADDEARNWLEIWNDVFIQFDWQGKLRNPERPSDGWEKSGMPNLPFASIDTGLGLERTVAVLEGKSSVYDTDAFLPILAKIDALRLGSDGSTPTSSSLTDSPFWESDSASQNKNSAAGQNLGHAKAKDPLPEGGGGARATQLNDGENPVASVTVGADQGNQTPETQTARRIIADHIRTSCFCIADGVMPANNGRGYVLRRLIRRAVLKGQRVLGFNDLFMHEVAEAVFDTFGDHYNELFARRGIIEETLRSEEALFRRTLNRGMELLSEQLLQNLGQTIISAPKILDLPIRDSIKSLKGSLPSGGFEDWTGNQREAYTKDLRELVAGEPTDFLRAVGSIRGEILHEHFVYASSLKVMGVLPNAYDPVWNQTFEGSAAFQLYDTFGFPLEVTQEICAEVGVPIDIDGYEAAMKEAQERSRGAQGQKSAYGALERDGGWISSNPKNIEPVYDPYWLPAEVSMVPIETKILGMRLKNGSPVVGDPNRVIPIIQIMLEQNPFYIQSGGQESDRGEIVIESDNDIVFALANHKQIFASSGWLDVRGPFRRSDRTRVDELMFERERKGLDALPGESTGLEYVSPDLNPSDDLSEEGKLQFLLDKFDEAPVIAQIDLSRRSSIQRNHTVTHLLQAALRNELGTSVTQAGSFVGPDNLRFDFTYNKALTEAQIEEIESVVNAQILKNIDVKTYVDIPIDEARAKGAMALFGEKYGDKVRMVEIGEFSKELCGGTHVRTTGEIGLFKIVSESSAASGVRRIEAITGEAAYDLFKQESNAIREAASLLKANPKELVSAVERTVDQLKDERKKREKAEMAAMSGTSSTNEAKSVNGVDFYVKNLGDSDPKVASQALDNEANNKPNQVTLMAVVSDKVTFMCKVGSDAQAKGAHAGNLLKELAKIAGGGGGGQPGFATAGGRDPGKAEEALAAAEAVLRAMLD